MTVIVADAAVIVLQTCVVYPISPFNFSDGLNMIRPFHIENFQLYPVKLSRQDMANFNLWWSFVIGLAASSWYDFRT